MAVVSGSGSGAVVAASGSGGAVVAAAVVAPHQMITSEVRSS